MRLKLWKSERKRNRRCLKDNMLDEFGLGLLWAWPTSLGYIYGKSHGRTICGDQKPWFYNPTRIDDTNFKFPRTQRCAGKFKTNDRWYRKIEDVQLRKYWGRLVFLNLLFCVGGYVCIFGLLAWVPALAAAGRNTSFLSRPFGFANVVGSLCVSFMTL